MLRCSSAAAALLAAAASILAVPGAAAAGTYRFTQDTTANVTGWQFSHEAGYHGCSRSSHGGICSDGDVPLDTPLRIFATGSVAAGAGGRWEFVAPPTTSFVSGQVSLSYHTTAGTTFAYLEQRLRAQGYSGVRSHVVYDNSSGTAWSITPGEEAFAVNLESDHADDLAEKWNNTLAVTSLTATLRDDTAPALALDGPLADGLWHAEHQPVCLDVSASDAGSGVASATLSDQSGAVLDRDAVALGAGPQPGDAVYAARLCATPAALGDGTHHLSLNVTDAAGESAVRSFDLRIDAHAPDAVGVAPAGTTSERRPAVGFHVEPGPSGLAELEASLDGQPMLVAGDAASLQPASDLAFGEHTVSWHAADQAGNSRDGIWTFRVVDVEAPTLAAAAPADGWQGEERRPGLAFRLSDGGTGVDPASVRVLLDGVDVAGAGSLVDGGFSYTPAADLAFGRHRVRVIAADRAGNFMAPAEWGFEVVDRTPPAVSDPRPDDGSSGADRTPTISLRALDAGIGLASGGVVLELDGRPLAAQPLGDGRFGAVPQEPLAFGRHDVAAHAVDAAGNGSATLSWSFTVRDESAPLVGDRRPAPGSTVAGAEQIGFSLSDAGTGVDPDTLRVELDGVDVSGWGRSTGGSFAYSPAELTAGVHTVSVTVADHAGNVAGPVMWQFLVAAPAALGLHKVGGAGTLVAGRRTTLRFALRAGTRPLAGEEVRVSARAAGSASFGRGRVLHTSAAGTIAWSVAPHTTTRYRVTLTAHPEVRAETRVLVRYALRLHASRSRLAPGRPLRLSGHVGPVRGARVAVQLLTRHGWATVARPRVSRRGGFAATVLPRLRGRYLFRATAAASSRNAHGQSTTVAVRVR